MVGIQYLYGMIAYFLTGGLFAMVIRSELLSPSYHLIGPNQYLMAVPEHARAHVLGILADRDVCRAFVTTSALTKRPRAVSWYFLPDRHQ